MKAPAPFTRSLIAYLGQDQLRGVYSTQLRLHLTLLFELFVAQVRLPGLSHVTMGLYRLSKLTTEFSHMGTYGSRTLQRRGASA